MHVKTYACIFKNLVSTVCLLNLLNLNAAAACFLNRFTNWIGCLKFKSARKESAVWVLYYIDIFMISE